MRLGCFAFCCQPWWVSKLADAPLPLVSVAGFPLGLDLSASKAAAARQTVDAGAAEIDMVLNQGALRSGDLTAVAADVAAVRAAIPGTVLKVILETGHLTEDGTRTAARICVEEGADFLKTSSGYGRRGATVEDVRLLKAFGVPVKASAGIRTFEDAAALVEAGADRLGASRTAEILAGCV